MIDKTSIAEIFDINSVENYIECDLKSFQNVVIRNSLKSFCLLKAIKGFLSFVSQRST